MDEREFYVDIGGRIAARRNQLGLKQAQVAKQAGMSRAALANIEIGRQRVLVHQIYQLAQTLELPGPTPLLPSQSYDQAGPIPNIDRDVTDDQRAQIERLIESVPSVSVARLNIKTK